MTVRMVTFGLWETLLRDTPEQVTARRIRRMEETFRVLHEWGYDFSQADLSRAFDRARMVWRAARDLSSELSLRQKTGTLLAAIDPQLLLNLNPEQVEALAMTQARTFFDAPPLLVPEAREVILKLGASGLRLG